MSPGYDPRWDDDGRSRDAENDRPDLNRGGRAGTDRRDRIDVDPRDVFMQELSLPRGPDRERVYVHEHTSTVCVAQRREHWRQSVLMNS